MPQDFKMVGSMIWNVPGFSASNSMPNISEWGNASMSLLDELREATRHKADLSELIARGPKSPNWNHEARCFKDRDIADYARHQLKTEIGMFIQSKGRVRWRVRTCPVCQGFYICCDKRQQGH